MIIPPDPEKDPNLFSPTSSTPSLVPPPSDLSDIDTIDAPPRAHLRNPAFGYPFGSSQDDLGLGYNGEALPPYITATANPPVAYAHHDDGTDDSSDEEDTTPRASSSRLPITTNDVQPQSQASTSKIWENSSDRPKGIFPPLPPKWQKWWNKWRKWVYLLVAIMLAGLGIMVGLLVGLNSDAVKDDAADATEVPWKDVNAGGQNMNWVTYGESLNITYVPSRDGPFPEDGNITDCTPFVPLNSSSAANLLSRPFPAVSASVTKMEIPMLKNGSALQVLPDFTLIARGLGSSGTVEIVGSDAPPEVLAAGKEGVVSIDIIALYSGQQVLEDIVRVCQLSRGEQGIGLGIFTPEETDGKISNAYMLNPTSLPSFHVIIYLPPSAVQTPANPSISIPNITFELDRMAVRFGDLQNVVEFGQINVTSTRGGVDANHVNAEIVDISTGENSVRGRWNISESIVVNVTEGSILADVVIHNPIVDTNTTITNTTGASDNMTDNTTTMSNGWNSTEWNSTETNSSDWNSTDAYSSYATVAKITKRHKDKFRPLITGVMGLKRTVTTTFITTQGLLTVAYLNQPSSVALSGLFVNNQGDTDISIHPNYIGPFVVKDIWGQVRLPPPQPIYAMDPSGLGRRRALTYGMIDIPGNGIYSANGVNTTVLTDSVVALSGAAYWESNKTMTPEEVQAQPESGGQVLVLGAWGDTKLSFDGT